MQVKYCITYPNYPSFTQSVRVFNIVRHNFNDSFASQAFLSLEIIRDDQQIETYVIYRSNPYLKKSGSHLIVVLDHHVITEAKYPSNLYLPSIFRTDQPKLFSFSRRMINDEPVVKLVFLSNEDVQPYPFKHTEDNFVFKFKKPNHWQQEGF